MNNLNQQLTKAISDLIPEAGLMELKFGCRVKHKTWGVMNVVADGNKVSVDCVYYDNLIPSLRCPNYCGFRLEKIEILGIEPELRHIIHASIVLAKELLIEPTCSGHGLIIARLDRKPMDDDYSITYDLTKSLFGQTLEVRQWLLNLLTQ